MCDCEYPDFYESRKQKAKKSHICLDCGQEIKKGQYYFSDRGFQDDSWYWGKFCLDCKKLYEYLVRTDDCFCCEFGGLTTAIIDSGLHNEVSFIPYIVINDEIKEMNTTISEDDEKYNEELNNAFYADFFRLKK